MVRPTIGTIPVLIGSIDRLRFSLHDASCAGLCFPQSAKETHPAMPAPAANAVVLQGVRLDRGGRTILRELALAAPAGSITAVLGPTGTGQSIVLGEPSGGLVPAAGSVRVFARPVPRGPRERLETREGIGALLQGNGLLTALRVAENVALPLRAHTRLPEPLLRRL